MIIELKCIEKGHTDKRWQLNVKGEAAVLSTITGEEVARFPQSDALKRFKMPGLLEDERHFAIAFDEQTVRFALDVGSLNKIENFLYQPVRTATAPVKHNSGFDAPPISVPSQAAARPKQASGATTPVKVIFGVLGLLFALFNVLGFVGMLAKGQFHPMAVAIMVSMTALGLLLSAVCFRSIARARARAMDFEG